jgi:hypothetical protein
MKNPFVDTFVCDRLLSACSTTARTGSDELPVAIAVIQDKYIDKISFEDAKQTVH